MLPGRLAASKREQDGHMDRGFEVILFRPIDVGEVVEQINRRLETKI